MTQQAIACIGSLAIVLACARARPAEGSTPLTTIRVTSGLAKPSFLAAPPGDTTRVFILELDSGRVLILRNNGVILPTPFMTQSGVTTGNERGLLSMAFHPDYATNGYFYLYYTIANEQSRIRRYTVSANPDVADTSTGVDIITFPWPQSNHIGGWMAFGPDGYLYVSKGDGFLPGEIAQSDTSRYGKILRWDMDGGFPYAVPPDNPYFGEPSPKDEFWAKGLRNPWRCSFDRLTGDLYIGDVGDHAFEEIDFQPAGATGGANYGWPMLEGLSIHTCPDPCDTSGLVRPILVYSHGGSPVRCAITAGYVYRGEAIPDLQGALFFADFCSNQIWTIRVVGGIASQFTDRTAELAPIGGENINWIVSFGEDGRGELYICDLGGEVFKIISNPTSVEAGDGRLVARPTLEQATPNPSGTGFSLQVGMPAAGPARLRVYDASGRLVRTLLEGALAAGPHAVRWDARNQAGEAVPGGTYFLQLESGGEASRRKVTVLR